MNKRSFRIATGVGALALAAVGVSAGVSSAGTAPAPAPADAAARADGFLGGRLTVPPELAPPDGNRLDSVFKASGVQNYGCADGAWKLLEPAAYLTGITLAPVKRVTAIHFRGPSWQSDTDGSLVEGTAPVSAPSATPGSIPQLRITAAPTSRGAGVFGGVTFIQRLATVGGIAPAGGCTAGQTTAVRYTAVYRFFKASA